MLNDETQQVLTKILAGEQLSPAGEIVAREMSQALGIRKEDNGDMMIAWYPPADVANGFALEGGEEVDDLHVTIVFIPAECDADPEVVKAVTLLCCQYREVLTGEISGVGRFVLDGDEDAFFVTVDVPGLEQLRQCLLDKLCEAGVYVPQKHGFTPHMTLKYMPRSEPSPGVLTFKFPIVIDALSHVVRGGLRTTFDMWDWEKEAAEDDPRGVARSRPEDPEAAARFDHTTKAGMDACVECGAPMLEKDGNKACVECAKTAKAAPDLPVDLTYVALPHPDSLKKDADGREWQYTLGPLYAPGVADAHDEYAEDDDLHRAVIQYSLKNDRRIKLQHDTSREVGTWVELVRWPYEHSVTLIKADGAAEEVTLPAGTVYLGVLWDDDAWAAIKDGRLGGLSLGGRAVRINEGGPNA